MSKPQQPELHRSRRAPSDRDALEDSDKTEDARQDAATKRKKRRGPVPEESRPGHHPEKDQDKPQLRDRGGRE